MHLLIALSDLVGLIEVQSTNSVNENWLVKGGRRGFLIFGLRLFNQEEHHRVLKIRIEHDDKQPFDWVL